MKEQISLYDFYNILKEILNNYKDYNYADFNILQKPIYISSDSGILSFILINYSISKNNSFLIFRSGEFSYAKLLTVYEKDECLEYKYKSAKYDISLENEENFRNIFDIIKKYHSFFEHNFCYFSKLNDLNKTINYYFLINNYKISFNIYNLQYLDYHIYKNGFEYLEEDKIDILKNSFINFEYLSPYFKEIYLNEQILKKKKS